MTKFAGRLLVLVHAVVLVEGVQELDEVVQDGAEVWVAHVVKRMAVAVGDDEDEGLELRRATFWHGGEDDVSGERGEHVSHGEHRHHQVRRVPPYQKPRRTVPE
jgi:hypothetical protein